MHVYDVSQICNQKFCMHLIPKESFVYFIDTNRTSQTILMRLPPMYISNVSEFSLLSLLWNCDTFLDLLDTDACAYFKALVPQDMCIEWLPSINNGHFLMPISDKCTCFDSEDNVIDTDTIQTGCLVESIVAINGFKYRQEPDNKILCEIDYELFQIKQCVLSKPSLAKCETSLFFRLKER